MKTMSKEPPQPPASDDANRHHAGLFASLVLQQTNLALIYLGRAPQPETGQTTTDVETASVFIDTLEMLAAKTKGNLSKTENDLLQQSLTSLRLAFVAAVDAAPGAASSPAPATAAQGTAAPSPTEPAKPAEPTAGPEEDLRKKFVKRY
jgi:hypothetical protein